MVLCKVDKNERFTAHSYQSIPQGRVISMGDIQKLKIMQHNKLIESAVKMDKIPLKLFELAVAAIDVETALSGDPKENRTFSFSTDLIYKVTNTTDNNKYSRMRNGMKELREKAHLELIDLVDEKEDKYEVTEINVISQIKWNNYKNIVEISFTPEIMPFLVDLKKNGLYTQYSLSDVAKMTSKYSIVLFKWLMMNYNQFSYYQGTKKRNEKQLWNYQNPIIEISELRRITDTKKEYSHFSNFERWILKKPIEEINQFTNYEVSYEKIRNGRSVKAIQFFIKEKPLQKDIPNSDIVFISEKQDIKEKSERLFTVMTSKYTKLLLEQGIINGFDTTNTPRMLLIGDVLIPMFEKIEDKLGYANVEKHVQYVKSHGISNQEKMVDWVSWQIKCTKRYLQQNNIQ